MIEFIDLEISIILFPGSIPSYYREVFETCSRDGDPVHRDVFQALLTQSKLSGTILATVWNLTGPPQGLITRTNFYKALALLAWAQQGKEPTDKHFENFSGKGLLPLPDHPTLKKRFKANYSRIPDTGPGRFIASQSGSIATESTKQPGLPRPNVRRHGAVRYDNRRLSPREEGDLPEAFGISSFVEEVRLDRHEAIQ